MKNLKSKIQNPKLKDRVCIVTGAARGIGRAIAEKLTAAACHVVIADVDEEGAARTAEEMRGSYPQSRGFAIRADVTQPADVEAMVHETVERLGAVHVLVNNSGITADALLLRLSPEAYARVLGVNLMGAVHCIRAVVSSMVQEKWGRIINISSVIGLIGNVGQANYAASKSGMIALTRSAARQLAPFGITVNAVAPGFIRTGMTASLPPNVVEEMQSHIPVGRLGEAEDVAACVAFLVSDAASYVTGQILTVDGGMVM